VTARSTNIIKEYRNYLWKKDKLTDKPLNVPVDAFNHAMDGARYAIGDVLSGKKSVFRVRRA
jgi:phage terminase large subunit